MALPQTIRSMARSTPASDPPAQQDSKIMNLAEQATVPTSESPSFTTRNSLPNLKIQEAVKTSSPASQKRSRAKPQNQNQASSMSTERTQTQTCANTSKRNSRLSNAKRELAAIEKIGSRKMEEDGDEDFTLSIKIRPMDMQSGQAGERKNSLRWSTRLQNPDIIQDIKVMNKEKTARKVYSNRYRYTLGESPYPDFEGPSPDMCYRVYELLKTHHVNEPEASVNAALPSGVPIHASGGITVDSMVQVLISQVSRNEFCMLALKNFREAFPFHQDGKTHVGSVPNYHDVLTADLDKIAASIAASGCQQDKAVRIKALLTDIYTKNFKSLYPGIECKIAVGEIVGADVQIGTDFVPGLLSIDYLDGLKRDSQALFDELVKFKGFGVKSAACLMSFHYGLPFFAVDTHVYHVTNLLGWFPKQRSPNRDRAGQHMDTKVPNDIKLVLHQLFWHHRKSCRECGGTVEQGRAPRDCPLRNLKDLSRLEIAKKKVDGGKKRSTEEVTENSLSPTKSQNRKRSLSDFGKDQSDSSIVDPEIQGEQASKKRRVKQRIRDIQGKTRCYWQEGDPGSVPGYDMVEAPRDNNFGRNVNMRPRLYWQRKRNIAAAIWTTVATTNTRLVTAQRSGGARLIFRGEGVKQLLGGGDAIPPSSDTPSDDVMSSQETNTTTQVTTNTENIAGMSGNDMAEIAAEVAQEERADAVFADGAANKTGIRGRGTSL